MIIIQSCLTPKQRAPFHPLDQPHNDCRLQNTGTRSAGIFIGGFCGQGSISEDTSKGLEEAKWVPRVSPTAQGYTSFQSLLQKHRGPHYKSPKHQLNPRKEELLFRCHSSPTVFIFIHFPSGPQLPLLAALQIKKTLGDCLRMLSASV